MPYYMDRLENFALFSVPPYLHYPIELRSSQTRFSVHPAQPRWAGTEERKVDDAR